MNSASAVLHFYDFSLIFIAYGYIEGLWSNYKQNVVTMTTKLYHSRTKRAWFYTADCFMVYAM